jgi:diguanylate cyclase (GGDEF)-like protein/PAS domain S-box-containing protein
MKKPIILIIEDHPITRKMLKVTLETTQNYDVIEANTGSKGLVMAQMYKPDLILQDIVLGGGMNGFELNKKLRALPHIKHIPILALSGFLVDSNEQPSQHGFTAFLLKPIEPSQLIDVIKVHLPLLEPSTLSIGEGQHILIADDNPIQLKLLSMQLKNAGFKVTTATDGEMALKEAKAKSPDAIISDILMPKLDGFGLCLAIRKEPKLNTIPVILLTSHYLEDADVDLAHKVGATRYITRTPDEKILINELIQCLKEVKPVSSDISYELENDINEQHTHRLIRQLEQQILSNTGLSQLCALQTAQLNLLGGIAEALTNVSEDFDKTLKNVLHSCLDAAGISKGALYITQADGSLKLQQIIGYKKSERKKLETFFGRAQLLGMALKTKVPYAIPSDHFSKQTAQKFLTQADVSSALIVPLTSRTVKSPGVLFLGSDSSNLTGDTPIAYARALGAQLGQSMALVQTFETLAFSEEQHRQLVEISPDAIFIQQDEKFSFVNTAGMKLLGANKPKQLQNHSVFEFFKPEYQLAIKKHLTQLRKEQATPLVEEKIVTIDNKSLDVEIVASSFTYQDKPAIYLIMRDISERKRSQLHLEVQYAIAWTLAESSTLNEATTQILKIICDSLKWDIGAIWAVDKKEDVLRCITVWQTPSIQSDDFQKKCLNVTFAPGVGFPGKVWQSGKAIWNSNFKDDSLREDVVDKLGLNMATCFPIVYENEILGVIEFFNRDIYKTPKDLLSWFESIGSQFGLFLKRKHMEGQMLYLAEHDVLTGLANRKLIEEYLLTALSKSKKYHNKLAILFIDLDHFKFINDSMGHQVGDQLLIEVAKKLQNCLRPGDSIGRLGGDEFIVILQDINSNEDVIPILKRIQKKLENKIILGKKEFFINVSIGISLYPDDGRDSQTLIKNADIAMYRAKEKGRNNYQFCTTEMTSKAENRVILQNDLHLALDNDEFILYYQPKIDIKTQKVIGMEALIRWQKTDKIVLPGTFFYAAEESELIIPITEWVLRTACLQNKKWQKKGLPEISVAINLSINNLNVRLLEVVEQALKDAALNPICLEIELTESILMKNVENNIQILSDLKKLGLKIAIDDFGTGYSSLSYLTRFPIDYLKIDQSFVRDLAKDPNNAAIIVAIIAMAHSLGFKVIAEGVETHEQLSFLTQHGADEIQGYYFSPPLSAKEAAHFLQNGRMEQKF